MAVGGEFTRMRIFNQCLKAIGDKKICNCIANNYNLPAGDDQMFFVNGKPSDLVRDFVEQCNAKHPKKGGFN